MQNEIRTDWNIPDDVPVSPNSWNRDFSPRSTPACVGHFQDWSARDSLLCHEMMAIHVSASVNKINNSPSLDRNANQISWTSQQFLVPREPPAWQPILSFSAYNRGQTVPWQPRGPFLVRGDPLQHCYRRERRYPLGWVLAQKKLVDWKKWKPANNGTYT